MKEIKNMSTVGMARRACLKMTPMESAFLLYINVQTYTVLTGRRRRTRVDQRERE